MIMDFKNILSFLSDLSLNNNREWFNDNKERYLKVKNEFDRIVQHLIPLVHKIDPSIGSLEPNDCIFRIYRDVRFSKNKDPYKIHFGAYISKDGRKSKQAGYYLHIQPGHSFVAAGAYMPEPDILKEIRLEILDKTEDFKKIIYNKEFKKNFPKLEGEKLKTIPKGFPKDFEDAEFLKLKSFEVTHSISDDLLFSPSFDDYLVSLIKLAYPYNNFMNNVIKAYRQEI
jgi:uncharacterized protein (TIGR02453 family)